MPPTPAHLCVTRQYAEVLGPGEGKARVSRQYVEVLASAIFQERSGDSDLGVDGVADEWVSPGGLDDLGLNQAAEAIKTHSEVIIQDVGLDHTLLVCGPVYLDVRHTLGLTTTGDEHVGTVCKTVIDDLALAQTAGRVISVSVVSEMNLGIIGIRSNAVSSTLAFSQVVSAGKGGTAKSQMHLTHTVHPGLVLFRHVSEPLDLLQSVTYYITGNRRFDRQYFPFVGEGPATPIAPSQSLAGPMEGITAPFQLVYPAMGEVTDSVTLRAPNLGNKDRLTFQRINRETRGGTLVVFADPTWPKTQTLALTFSGMTRAEAQDYLDFLSEHLGEEVGVIDWESRYWRGIITTMEPVVEDSPNYFSFGFEFEGEMAEWLPQIIPVVPGTPLRRTKPPRGETPSPMEPIPPVEPTTDTYSAESDASILVGQPLYIKSSGHADLARANTHATAAAVGFAVIAASPTFTVEYVTEGKLTLTDWTAVASVATLTPGVAYYLDAAAAGRITSVVPTSGYIVRLGRATSTATLDIEIEPSMRL